MKYILRSALTAMSLCLLPLANPASAADYPERPIRLIVPYSAGGITDVIGRIVAMPASEVLGQSVVIENRAGAGGTIGTNQVARAPADGYTIVLGALSPLVISKITNKELPYDPFTDLKPVMQVAQSSLVLVVNPELPVNSVQDLVKLLKEKPGAYSYATAGAGTPSHLAGELFKTIAGVDAPAIHYKGFSPALQDLLGGRIHFTFDSIGTLLTQIADGRVRALAVAGDTRSPQLPDVPTMAESGLGEVSVAGWYGVLAPAGTPDAVVNKLNQAFVAAVGQEQVKRQFHDLSLQGTPGSPQDFAQLMRFEYERWNPIVSRLELE
ncbi:Bug family tripartite tricarboxylate transporter substrate binding protein [Paracandidimonas soli]|uniref:Tripartite-type tricarboxylate transporter receptor subunit TctC n=1 Tax=Paracandidimonas soli TaxID=1917182 RepID=A0A4V2VSP0_9BURK|nr:tripartite tricarboxylate transporter substrate binding protein [Paracandidimonas soli]TCV03120.1 tripartite-type tricarboxylate transporter receptor subunit TctC [Paracandidimonas soli]